MARYWLEKVVGEWGDPKGSRYKVTMDDSGFSCSVVTIRKTGRIQTGRGMIKYDSKNSCVMWGASYYLEVDENNSANVYWIPLRNVQPYTWHRLEASVRDDRLLNPSSWEAWKPHERPEEAEEGWRETSGVARLEDVVGSWKDDLGSRYIISLDESGKSCSATIVLQDGRTSLASETIKYYAKDVYWGEKYYLLATENSSICWKSVKSGEEFRWQSTQSTEEAPVEVPYILSESNLQALLKQMVGTWSDEELSTFIVTMDESGHSCSVETQRSDGKTVAFEGVLKYDAEMQCLMWGKKYYLDIKGAGEVEWVHIDNRDKSFRWLLCQSGLTEVQPIKTWSEARLEELVGQWEDDRATVFTVSLDESRLSCSVKNDLLEGESRPAEALTVEEESKRLWWGSAYYADLRDGTKGELLWTPTKSSKLSFKWHRYCWC